MRPSGAAGAAILLLLSVASVRAQGLDAAGDSLRFRWEVGASTDYTNEIYYLDSLATPTLVERQQFEVPERRYAGVLLGAIEGTRASGRTRYVLTQEASYGDLLRRASTTARWRQEISPDWQLLVTPRFEYRRDRTLGRDFEEYQASAAGRVRHTLGTGLTSVESGLLADWLRTTGSGTGLLPDRGSLGATAGIDEFDFEGVDWRADYTIRGRVFPDSSVRDHFEHDTEARLRMGWGLSSSLVLGSSVIRRVTMKVAPTSRDNFWEEGASLDLLQEGPGAFGWPLRAEAEAVQFDLEDGVLYFNHRELRARTGVRWQPMASWTLEAGPLGEWLSAPRADDESYAEYGGYAEFEAITAGTLWNVTPSAGSRRYDAPATTGSTDVYDTGRSSYRYLQLDVIGDQRLPAGLRARLLGNARFEFHDDSAENATSLYFSFDVRRLF